MHKETGRVITNEDYELLSDDEKAMYTRAKPKRKKNEAPKIVFSKNKLKRMRKGGVIQ